MNDQDVERLKKLVKQRRKIEAIKLYREWTGCSLKEAKEAIEALERGNRCLRHAVSHRSLIWTRLCAGSTPGARLRRSRPIVR